MTRYVVLLRGINVGKAKRIAMADLRALLADQWCPDGILQAPPVGGYAEKHLGVTVTARNWNTTTKLADLL